MGKRGPKPTPTPVLKLRGSTLVTRRREAAEVSGPAGTPECPDWLDDEAQTAWHDLVPMLVGMGVLTRIDGRALARYCHTWAQWRKNSSFVAKHGVSYPLRSDDGKVKCVVQWPQVAVARALAHELTRLEQEFGMTPSARARLQLAPARPDSIGNAKSSYFSAG